MISNVSFGTALAAFVLATTCASSAAPFQPESLAVYRTGDGASSLTFGAAPVFIDEYASDGTLIQSIPVATAPDGANLPLVAIGISTTEGLLTLSDDERFLVFAGYGTSLPYTAPLIFSNSGSIPRSLARLDADGEVDTTTSFSDPAIGGSIRGVASIDGTDFWFTGSASGVRYTSHGSGGFATQVNQGPTNFRGIHVGTDQLFTSLQPGGAISLGTVGGGFPTTASQPIDGLTGFPTGSSVNAVAIMDEDGGVDGDDLIYVADDVNGIEKYSFDGLTWTFRGSVGDDADNYRGITAKSIDGTIWIYATRGGGATSIGGGELVAIRDRGERTELFDPTLEILATAEPNTAFRGVAFTPLSDPDLVVEVSGPSDAPLDEEFDYTLTAYNYGGQDADDVAITFELPPEVDLSSVTAEPGFSEHISGSTITFSEGFVGGGFSAEFTITVIPTAAGALTLPAGAAVIDPDDLVVEYDESNNESYDEILTEVTDFERPFITRHPSNVSVSSVSNVRLVTLVVEATGNPSPTYQWYEGFRDDTSNPLSGETSSRFTTNATEDFERYWVRVTNSEGGVSSRTGSISIYVPVEPPVDPPDDNYEPGDPIVIVDTDWTGSADGTDWSNTDNWSNGGPNSRANVTINTGDSISIFGGSTVNFFDFQAGSLSLQGTSVLYTGWRGSSSASIGGFDGSPVAFTMLPGARARFEDGIIFGGPGGGDVEFNYAGGGLNTNRGSDFYADAGIASDADNDAVVPSVIQWNFQIDRSRVFLPLDVGNLSLETTASSQPNQIRLDIIAAGDSFEIGDSFLLVRHFNFSGRFLTPDGLETIRDDSVFTTHGSTFLINYDDIAGGITATVVDGTNLVPPGFSIQPLVSQSIPSGENVILTSLAAGVPEPTYQWYIGDSGDTTNPIPGANLPDYEVVALSETTRFWVRTSNSAGTEDSRTAEVIAILSDNASLLSVSPSSGQYSPSFSSSILNYLLEVPSQNEILTLTPSSESSAAVIRINGAPIASGSVSPEIPLLVGSNVITILVTAEDMTTTKTYTINATRAEPMEVATESADLVTSSSAVLHGTVNPKGDADTYFEYGTTTSYGSSTALQDIAADSPLSTQAILTGLPATQEFHFRAVAVKGAEVVYGEDMTFTTNAADPFVITGNPVGITTTTASLVGAVNNQGLGGAVHFEYGLTSLFGNVVPATPVTVATGLVDHLAAIDGLIPDATYRFRIVLTTPGGIMFYGDTVTFVATPTGGTSTGSPTAPPTVTTGGTVDITTFSAEMRGVVNPNGGSALTFFEYGTTTSYGQSTAPLGVGNVDTDAAVSITGSGIQPGREYHYRLVAQNSLGTTYGEDGTFTSNFLPPTATTGDTTILSTTSVQVAGTVRARNTPSEVIIEYGTNSTSLNRTVQTIPANVTGNASTPVIADLTDLVQGTTYYYRVKATSIGGTTVGLIRSFNLGILSGLDRRFPDLIDNADHSGSLTVNLTPPEIGSGWRFAGEPQWRASGTTATGLTSGDRLVEYRPAAGHIQPPTEPVAIDTASGVLVVDRAYTPTGATGSGSLIVSIKPDTLSSTEAAELDRAQWRFTGEDDEAWKNTATEVSDLVPGNYVLESKPVAGRVTPAPFSATVVDGELTQVTITYYLAGDPVGANPLPVSFNSVSTDETKPYAFVGQILTDAGAGTGFVVKSRVVATAGHVVFDDGVLAATTGVRWLFQREADIHEPVPVEPRGFYLMTGYADQRAAENTPGISAPESQNLDAAAMYFSMDISRNGFSGFLASDSTVNEFVVSSLEKTLLGYPVEGVLPASIGKVHSTPISPVSFASAFGQTYTTSEIRGLGGMSGGPLCVQSAEGNWYPAGIFLGGTAQTVVRAIDATLSDLFGFAEASASTDLEGTGGEAVVGTPEPSGTPGLGAIRVTIEPAAARAAGARWRINAGDPYQASGSTIINLSPNTYTVLLSTVPGFVPPASQELVINADELLPLTFTYEEIIPAPVINSPNTVTVDRGEPITYQIEATPTPDTYNLLGSLPTGVSFDPLSGLISGTAQEAGLFPLTLSVTNIGGAGSLLLNLTSLPILEPQAIAGPFEQPMTYQVIGNETGPGVSWSATGLPDGLSIDTESGLVSGTPNFAGVFSSTVSLTRNGATATTTLTFTITGNPPVFTLQPPATRSIEFGTGTTFAVAASGSPSPTYQWYEGTSGDVSIPIAGATAPTYSTPALASPVSYWVRATSISGSADSSRVDVSVLPSSNPNLNGITPSSGDLSPSFNPGILGYQVTVPNAVTEIMLTPVVQISQTTVTIDTIPATPGQPSDPIPLAVGTNLVTLLATAGDGVAEKAYTVEVVRLPAPLAITGDTADVTFAAATLNGSVNPNGSASYYFEYGLTPSFGESTPDQAISGQTLVAVNQAISGLSGSTVYYYRIALVTPGGIIFGAEQNFTTEPDPPLVATGNPVGVTTADAFLTGGVNPRGLSTTLYFEYGPSGAFGSQTADFSPDPDDGTSVSDVSRQITGLVANQIYFYRLVATSSAGTSFGETLQFTAITTAGSGDGIADSPPTVTTGAATDLSASSATLQGSVLPNDGSTLVWFEYGTSASYGSATPTVGVGNGSELRDVTALIAGLLPSTEYHFRIVAENSQGRSFGLDQTFESIVNLPVSIALDAVALTPESVRVSGTVNPRGSSTVVTIEYGTDGLTFPDGVLANESPLNGEEIFPVTADITDLEPSGTYYFRIRSENSGGVAFSDAVLFQPGALLGLVQELPQSTDASARSGQVIVNTLPADIGGWRFTGETLWRTPGIPATGLTTSDRQIEFQSVAGYIQPLPESVSIVSGQPAVVFDAIYYSSDAIGTASLTVNLEPSSATAAQWRLAGVDADPWRDSGATLSGLESGNYLLEFRAVSGRQTPTPRSVVLGAGEDRILTVTYFAASAPLLNPPTSRSYETAISNPQLPYAYVGQIMSDVGTHSGFVVKRRVVATAAMAVFDDSNFSFANDIQWRLLPDQGNHVPKPTLARGGYVFDGYAAQRETEATPGTFSNTSHNLNVAALYFVEDAGQGGFSGFLASDNTPSEYLVSASLKTLAGYPITGVTPQNFDRLHATNPATTSFTHVQDRVYESAGLRGLGGMTGGPLCVQLDGGAYYPSGIYVGGTTRGIVRAIDSEVVDLFSRAEVSGNGGDNNTGGGITHSSFESIGSSTQAGAIQVFIEPAEARNAGGGWRLKPEASYRPDRNQKAGLNAGTYVLQFTAVSGFDAPAEQTVVVSGGQLARVTFTYGKGVNLSPLETWRQENFGPSATNSGDAADDEDPDGDGEDNIDEFIAGTDPNDSGDVLRILAVERDGGTFTVEVPGVSGRVYLLERTLNLNAVVWPTVDIDGPLSGDGMVELSDDSAPNGAAFYRVRATFSGE
ncbi:cadherin-like beta sandwich domain-containing protein [Haloferula sp.]|uniref:cadherin-like beta sandwich domain-containing protein n=1 Tax=Haloferula sp. TaxID=2497595 RepID=UPI00329F974E